MPVTMKRFSKVATDGRCPRCGGTSFKSKRSLGGILVLGFLARKTRVRCETCGMEFRRR